MSKVIISCAVTGSVHTPSMSPYLPITPQEIATQAIEAAEAGASVLHLHARDPETGKPSPDPDIFMRFLPQIKQSTAAVVNITTGGGQGISTLSGGAPGPAAGSGHADTVGVSGEFTATPGSTVTDRSWRPVSRALSVSSAGTDAVASSAGCCRPLSERGSETGGLGEAGSTACRRAEPGVSAERTGGSMSSVKSWRGGFSIGGLATCLASRAR